MEDLSFPNKHNTYAFYRNNIIVSSGQAIPIQKIARYYFFGDNLNIELDNETTVTLMTDSNCLSKALPHLLKQIAKYSMF